MPLKQVGALFQEKRKNGNTTETGFQAKNLPVCTKKNVQTGRFLRVFAQERSSPFVSMTFLYQ